MDAAQLERAQELFWSAVEAGQAEREAILEHGCAGDAELAALVRGLLASHDGGRGLPSRAPGLGRPGEVATLDAGNDGEQDTAVATPTGRLANGSHLGHYRIVRLVGGGGMGEVYEAEQERPVRRRVALKVIRWGFDSADVVARFDGERQALALMDHSGIARVFDADTTEQGCPYFVMEFVSGVPLTDYCDAGRLPTRERLGVFLHVCDAVHHAHQKGIIHRDLKPSNILVADQDGQPLPKVIDFGIAKATTRPLTERTIHTEMGQLVGTPEYMSPEQATLTSADLDTRADVYALGVILYELLVGALPFDSEHLRQAGFEGLLRTIREEEPVRPSTRLRILAASADDIAARRATTPRVHRRELHGELDWITMKALEKERNRRYQSVADFRADIERYLRDEPVLAGPPSTLYRTRKFVRRHRVGVAAGSAIAIALVAGSIAATVGMVKAQRAEKRARDEAATAEQTSDFLVNLFEVSDPNEARGSTITAREVLDKGAARIQTELADQPIVRARMMHTIGSVYGSIGLYAQADTLLQKALAERIQLLGYDNAEVASSIEKLCGVAFARRDMERSRVLAESCLALRERTLPPGAPDLARSMTTRAGLYLQFGDPSRAESLLLRSERIQASASGVAPVDLASTLGTLAILYSHIARDTLSLQYFERAARSLSMASGEDHPDIGTVQGRMGEIYLIRGQLDSAGLRLTDAIRLLEKCYGPGNPQIARSYWAMGHLLFRSQRYDSAEIWFHRASRADSTNWGYLWDLARVYMARGEAARAEPLFQHGLAVVATRNMDPTTGDPQLAYMTACYEALHHHRDAAIAHLRRARGYEPGWDVLFRAGRGGIIDDPDLAGLRPDPEFRALVNEGERNSR